MDYLKIHYHANSWKLESKVNANLKFFLIIIMINFCKILLIYDDFDDLYFVYNFNFLFMIKYL